MVFVDLVLRCDFVLVYLLTMDCCFLADDWLVDFDGDYCVLW